MVLLVDLVLEMVWVLETNIIIMGVILILHIILIENKTKFDLQLEPA